MSLETVQRRLARRFGKSLSHGDAETRCIFKPEVEHEKSRYQEVTRVLGKVILEKNALPKAPLRGDLVTIEGNGYRVLRVAEKAYSLELDVYDA